MKILSSFSDWYYTFTPPTHPSYIFYCWWKWNHFVFFCATLSSSKFSSWWFSRQIMKVLPNTPFLFLGFFFDGENKLKKFCILSFSMTGSQRLLQLLLMLWTFQKVRMVVCFTNLFHSERKILEVLWARKSTRPSVMRTGEKLAWSLTLIVISARLPTDLSPPRLKSSRGRRKSQWGLSCKLGYLSVANELLLPCQ